MAVSDGAEWQTWSELNHFFRTLFGRVPPPPWFERPPANVAQEEVRLVLGDDLYEALVEERRIIVRGSAGGWYTLWAARALRGADAYYPRVFDEQRRIELCVALQPQRRLERAWEDEWNGLVRWIQLAEPVFLATANPVAPRRTRGSLLSVHIKTSAEVIDQLHER